MKPTPEQIYRLNQAVYALNLTQKQLALDADVTEKTVGHLLQNKKGVLTPAIIRALVDKHGISYHWLIAGTGVMRKSPILAAIAELLIEHSPEPLTSSELQAATKRILAVVLNPKGEIVADTPAPEKTSQRG